MECKEGSGKVKEITKDRKGTQGGAGKTKTIIEDMNGKHGGAIQSVGGLKEK